MRVRLFTANQYIFMIKKGVPGCGIKLFPYMIFLLIILGSGCQNMKKVYSETTLKLLTYNTHYGANTAGVFNPEATVGVIRRSGANIIALQEVDRGWSSRSQYLDEAEYLARELQMNYVFGATLDHHPLVTNAGKFGIMILSQYPIEGENFHLLPGSLEQRGVLLAWIKTPADLIPVACTHLGLSVSDRTLQIAEILNWLPRQANGILLGDFNTEPYSPELAPLQSAFVDLQERAGVGQVGTFLFITEPGNESIIFLRQQIGVQYPAG